MKKVVKKRIQHSYYEPAFHSYKARGPYPHNLTLGYENEVENSRDDASDKTKEVINQYNFLYAKEDDSLDSGGCEINTHPFNLNWFHKHNVIKYIDDVIDAGFRAKRSCGFHIHMGRKFFTDAHLAKMVKLFYTNGPFLKKVSLRQGWSFEEYSSVKEVAGQIQEELLDIWNYKEDENKPCPELDFNEWKYCRKAVESLDNEGLKMSALNLMHDNTIEVRIFQGTLNKKLIQAYLEFCMATALYTKQTAFHKISLRGFRGYVRRHVKLYKNLYNSGLLYGKVKKAYRWKKAA